MEKEELVKLLEALDDIGYVLKGFNTDVIHGVTSVLISRLVDEQGKPIGPKPRQDPPSPHTPE